MVKFLILNDLHFGKSQKFYGLPNVDIVRQANSQAKETLENMLEHFRTIKPDFVLQLGDTIKDSYDKDVDTQNTISAISLIQKIGVPTVHILGNHEIQALSKPALKKIFESLEIKQEFYGLKEFNDFNLVWLDLEIGENNKFFLDQKQIEFISKLDKDKKLIVLSHYSLIPLDKKGTIYWEDNPQGMYYQNYQEALNIFKTKNVGLFVNAHVHLMTHTIKNNWNFISSPAFSENIAGINYPENNPGVYSILEIDNQKIIFSSYSDRFCFIKVEISI